MNLTPYLWTVWGSGQRKSAQQHLQELLINAMFCYYKNIAVQKSLQPSSLCVPYKLAFWHEATPKKSISCKKTKNPSVAPFRAPSLWDSAWRNILCYSCMPLFSSRTFPIHSSVSLLVCGYKVTPIGPHFKLSNEALGLPPLLQHWCSFLLPLPVNYRVSVQVQWRCFYVEPNVLQIKWFLGLMKISKRHYWFWHNML